MAWTLGNWRPSMAAMAVCCSRTACASVTIFAFVLGTATPAQHYPRVAAASDLIAGYISTEQYLWGLHRILDGITTSREPLQD